MTSLIVAQKIIKVGNSLAVTLPRQFAKQHHLKAGAPVFSKSVDGEIQYSTHQPSVSAYHEINDQEFVRLIKNVEARYGKVLQKLASLP